MVLSTEEDKLGEKERTQILLAEYNSLRSEINSRVSNACQVGTIAIAVLAICVNAGVRPNAIIALILISLILLWIIFHNFFNAALRVQDLEGHINKLADEELLIWENKRGGLAIGGIRLRLVLRFFRLSRYRLSK